MLDGNAAWLKSNANNLVLIEGHCDERGTNEYNLALGERRAKATMNYLVAQGVQANRITIISYGKERPVCTEKSEALLGQEPAGPLPGEGPLVAPEVRRVRSRHPKGSLGLPFVVLIAPRRPSARAAAPTATRALQQDVAQLRQDLNALTLAVHRGRGDTETVRRPARPPHPRAERGERRARSAALSARLDALAAEVARVVRAPRRAVPARGDAQPRGGRPSARGAAAARRARGARTLDRRGPRRGLVRRRQRRAGLPGRLSRLQQGQLPARHRRASASSCAASRTRPLADSAQYWIGEALLQHGARQPRRGPAGQGDARTSSRRCRSSGGRRELSRAASRCRPPSTRKRWPSSSSSRPRSPRRGCSTCRALPAVGGSPAGEGAAGQPRRTEAGRSGGASGVLAGAFEAKTQITVTRVGLDRARVYTITLRSGSRPATSCTTTGGRQRNRHPRPGQSDAPRQEARGGHRDGGEPRVPPDRLPEGQPPGLADRPRAPRWRCGAHRGPEAASPARRAPAPRLRPPRAARGAQLASTVRHARRPPRGRATPAGRALEGAVGEALETGSIPETAEARHRRKYTS